MRLLHTSDWHVGRRIRGRSRSEEHGRVLEEIVEIARSEKVDLSVVAGDLFDVSSPSPEDERLVYKPILSAPPATGRNNQRSVTFFPEARSTPFAYTASCPPYSVAS